MHNPYEIFIENLLNSTQNDKISLASFITTSESALISSIISVHILKDSELPTARLIELIETNINSLEKLLSLLYRNKDLQSSTSNNLNTLDESKKMLAQLFILEMESISYFTKRLLSNYDFYEKSKYEIINSSNLLTIISERNKFFEQLISIGKKFELLAFSEKYKNSFSKLLALSNVYLVEKSKNKKEQKNLEKIYPLYCYSAIGTALFSKNVFLHTLNLYNYFIRLNALIPFFRLLNHSIENLKYFIVNPMIANEYINLLSNFYLKSDFKPITSYLNSILRSANTTLSFLEEVVDSQQLKDLNNLTRLLNNTKLNLFELHSDKSSYLKKYCKVKPQTLKRQLL
ncbi:MAG: hypothetical protein QXF76_02550 [Candidatus Anstonellales archaeon]